MPTRQEVYTAIDTERAYQTWIERNPNRSTGDQKKVGEYLTMLRTYMNKADEAWTLSAGDENALETIRKIAGICVKCMEDHGAPRRQMPSDVMIIKLEQPIEGGRLPVKKAID